MYMLPRSHSDIQIASNALAIITQLLMAAASVVLGIIWALSDAGLPGTIWAVVDSQGHSATAPLSGLYLREIQGLWIRLGIAGILCVVWGVTLVVSISLGGTRLRTMFAMTAHGVTLASFLTLAPTMMDAGVALRVPRLVHKIEPAITELFRRWPTGIETVPGLGMVGPVPNDETRIYLLGAHSMGGLREGIGYSAEISPNGRAVFIVMASFNYKSGSLNGLVFLRDNGIEPEDKWISKCNIDWTSRRHIAERTYLVTLGRD